VTLKCWLFHRKFREELLLHVQYYNYDYVRWMWRWDRFKHCTKCHIPLLDPEREYMTPEQLESDVRMKMLDASTKS
jgi:hypothetical protein